MKIIGVGIAVAGAGIASYGAYRWRTTRPPPPPPPAKVETRMVVTEVPPSSVYPGQEFHFGGYLEDVNGNRLAGKTVELYIDGGVATSSTTDTYGRWDWNIVLNKTAVMYTLFPGDEEYIGCSRGGSTGAEVIARFRAWVESLPLSERDIPYLSFQDRLWTPNEVLREMVAGTPTGRLLQEAEEKLLRRV